MATAAAATPVAAPAPLAAPVAPRPAAVPTLSPVSATPASAVPVNPPPDATKSVVQTIIAKVESIQTTRREWIFLGLGAAAVLLFQGLWWLVSKLLGREAPRDQVD
jgi:hypothetical protein